MDIRLLQERTQQELINLEQKMKLAETNQDTWYIIDRIAQTIQNDAELGEYIRSISKKELNATLNEKRK